MDFGIFMEFERRGGGSQAAAFDDGFRMVDAAEAWGLDIAWLGEMHFTPARSVLSSPDGIAAELNAGGMLTPEQSERTLRILTQEIMPHFK